MTYFTSDDASLAFTITNETEAASAVTLKTNSILHFHYYLLSTESHSTLLVASVAFNRIIFCSEPEG